MTGTTPAPVLGTMTLGAQVTSPEADRIVGRFLDAGHRDLDTAYTYGEGKTEEYLGRALRERPRESFTIATKANPSVRGGLGPESVRLQLETSLRRLGLEWVDLFYLHQPDPATPIEITLEACSQLHRQGKFVALGLSNYAAWQVAEIWQLALRMGWIGPVAYQGMYNALTRDVERELFPCIRRAGIRFLTYNPLAGGFLTDRYRSVAELPESGRFRGSNTAYRDRYWKASYFQALDRVRSACAAAGLTVSTAALRWLLGHSRLAGERGDAVIIGGSTERHIEDNLAAFAGPTLAPEVLAALDEAWETSRPTCPKYFRP